MFFWACRDPSRIDHGSFAAVGEGELPIHAVEQRAFERLGGRTPASLCLRKLLAKFGGPPPGVRRNS